MLKKGAANNPSTDLGGGPWGVRSRNILDQHGSREARATRPAITRNWKAKKCPSSYGGADAPCWYVPASTPGRWFGSDGTKPIGQALAAPSLLWGRLL